MIFSATHLNLLALTVLADDTPRNTGPDFGKASPIGLLVVVLLLIGTFLLVRSMNRHLKKLPTTFDAEPEQPAAERAVGDGTEEPDGKPAG
ncbi:MAG TPA: hypothetical protein PKI77_03760 [Mycobacterium sp.]|nr:hypothetical protein [Mycobacterium sp.]